MNGAPEDPIQLDSLARELLEQGQFDAARQTFERALAIDPTNVAAALGLGRALFALGRSGDALHYLERAVQAEPRNAEALNFCGRALADAGHMDLAVEFLRQSVTADPGNLSHVLATIQVIQEIEFTVEYPWYEQFLIDCLENPELIHDPIANVAASLLWVKPSIQAAVAAEHLSATQIAALEQEPLLLSLLSKTIVRSWQLEQLVTKLRRCLLELLDPNRLTIFAAVAEQAFNSGYIQFQTDQEVALEQRLIAKGVTTLAPIELMALASYRALADLPGADALAGQSHLPAAIERVIQRTLREPLQERDLETQIVALTPIDDAVSLRVQAQYEEHPYPRWINIQNVDDRQQRLVDEIAANALDFEPKHWPESPKVLVPGCGTGYHPLFLARRHPEIDVLAIDLSRTSLAYAIRKQQELGLGHVRFMQADLLELGKVDDRFDYIDCSGVLHHMDSPLAGWRILTELLAPGGVMRIGLYSEAARRTIVAARNTVAALGIASTAAAIREFRQTIMSDPALEELRRLSRTTADFFSMGGIRDLIFHVQEHRFDLPSIKQALQSLNLEFGGFLLADRDKVRKFQRRYPSKAQWLELDCWAEFESEQPDTFYRMYQFYCWKRKP